MTSEIDLCHPTSPGLQRCPRGVSAAVYFRVSVTLVHLLQFVAKASRAKNLEQNRGTKNTEDLPTEHVGSCWGVWHQEILEILTVQGELGLAYTLVQHSVIFMI